MLIIFITIEAKAIYLCFLQIKIAKTPEIAEKSPPKINGAPELRIDNTNAMIPNILINTPEA